MIHPTEVILYEVQCAVDLGVIPSNDVTEADSFQERALELGLVRLWKQELDAGDRRLSFCPGGLVENEIERNVAAAK